MPRKRNTVYEILRTYFWERLPLAEQEQVREWLASDVHAVEKDNALKELWDSYDMKSDERALAAFEKVSCKLGLQTGVKRRGVRRRLIIKRIAAALVPVVAAAGMTWAVLKENVPQPNQSAPELAVTVAQNEFAYRLLPDSTQVWANESTTLTYEQTADGDRKVKLRGEAYFNVKKLRGSSFRVVTDHMTVKVLGTQFNVRSYEGEPETVVTLDSGEVEITSSSEAVRMSPGQTARYDVATGTLRTSESSEETEMKDDWRAGVLTFDFAQLDEIFDVLENYYGVRFMGRIPLNPDETYSMTFTGKEPIEKVMQIIGTVRQEGLDYEIEDRTITIY